MARRRRRKRQIVEGGQQENRYVVPTESRSRLYLPEGSGLWGIGTGTTSGLRERISRIDHKVQRRVAESVALIQSIINVRSDQIRPFTKRLVKGQRRGFHIVPVDPDVDEESVKDELEKLTRFFELTGFEMDKDRPDDFSDFCQMLVREVYTVDQVAAEIMYNRRGNPIAFRLLDGCSIKLVDPEAKSYRKEFEGYAYVQDVDDKIFQLYTQDTLIFDYQYKRADLKYRGYGYSPVEQCIDLITTLLFGHNFSRDQFVKNKVPQGFISVMGDVGQAQIDAIRENWIATMEGAGGQFAVPVLPSGKDGVGIDFKNIGQKNREMEYAKLMHFLVSLICAVFSIDPAEMGIKSDDSHNLAEASLDTRQGSSRDRGLSALLSFVERVCNKILQRVTDKFVFVFEGHDLDEEEKIAKLAKERLEAFSTVDEERVRAGLAPFEEEWSQMVANPTLVNFRQASEQAAMMGEEGPYGEEGEEEEPGEDEDLDDPEDYDEIITPDDLEEVEKSYHRFKELVKA